jgi:MFS family permease
VLGRLLVGLGIGVSAVVVPAYLGEVAPAPARGTIVELYEVHDA